MARLILASASPRRRELLANAGFSFAVVPSRVRESDPRGEPPAAFAERMARLKAENVARKLSPQDGMVVLGADTIVVLNGTVLGKPRSHEDARGMLAQLSGRIHEVITGVALAAPATACSAVAHERTRVVFRSLTSEEIATYVAGGEPLDKAGAYAIQGVASRFITRIEGCYFNVMGLPVSLVDRLLGEWEKG
ncbi:MAG: Maf family protein [Terriglobia bacterium]